MDGTQSFRFFDRGPSPLVRLVFFVALSLLLLFIDARYRYLESTRSALSVLITPIQRLAALPGSLWQEVGDLYITQSRQHSLITENEALHRQHQFNAAQLLQLQAMQAENQQLRNLAALPLRNEFTTQMVEIAYMERDVFKRRVLVHKGENTDLRAGQVVMDDLGIVGQITRVYPLLAEITLITEKNHAVPVQVLRNGLRAIVFGTGDTSQLSLRYMPVSADVQVDDILATSGIDGIYPPGIPVAKVVAVERDPVYPFARIACLPLAGVDYHRHLLVLSEPPSLPEHPVENPARINADKRVKSKKVN
ncbi:MAG: rod shape-determining protein MreC [Gallionella sp.]